jgi:cytochrome oxidase Cu insertion factor (SCO1/SenC/PrrC family)
MNATPPASARRSRFKFWLATMLFLGPFIAAFVIYHWFPQVLPSERTNYGDLVDPPRPLPALTFSDPEGKPLSEADFRGHWSLVYVGPAECEDACRERVHFSRQLWLALNDKRTRLTRVYIAPDTGALEATRTAIGEEHADLQWLGATGTTGYEVRRFFEIAHSDALYLIDPFGNWVMTYAPSAGADAVQQDFKGMQKDLKKLLKL